MNSVFRSVSLARCGVKNFFLKRPFCVSFEVTYSCNARCKHCNRGRPVDEQRATAQKYGEICWQIKPLVAQLSGGEPLLRKDLEQIAEALRIPNRAPYVIVITNGILLTKERYLRLRRAGADGFSISLDYPDERHDEFRRVPGLFRHIKTLIKEMESENKKSIMLCCVVQSDNFRHLLQMAELAREWNVNINFSAYNPLRTNNTGYMIQKEDLEEFKEIINQLLVFKKKHRIIYTSDYIFRRMPEYFDKGSIPDCLTGTRFFNVNPDGTLSPCGLITKNFKSKKELNEIFVRNNSCKYCYTSIRGNSEKPPWYLLRDSIRALR